MLNVAERGQGWAVDVGRLTKAVIICWYVVFVSAVGTVIDCEEAAVGEEMFRMKCYKLVFRVDEAWYGELVFDPISVNHRIMSKRRVLTLGARSGASPTSSSSSWRRSLSAWTMLISPSNVGADAVIAMKA